MAIECCPESAICIDSGQVDDFMYDISRLPDRETIRAQYDHFLWLLSWMTHSNLTGYLLLWILIALLADVVRYHVPVV